MVQIKSLNSVSLAKVLGLMYLILAVIVSPFIIVMVSLEESIGFAESIFVILFGMKVRDEKSHHVLSCSFFPIIAIIPLIIVILSSTVNISVSTIFLF